MKQAQLFGGLFFVSSLVFYSQRYFKANRSVPKFLVFAGASFFASSEWSRFLFLPIQQEAAEINNYHERRHRIVTKPAPTA